MIFPAGTHLQPGAASAPGVGFQPAELLATERHIWGLTFWLVVARKTPEVWLSSAGQGLCVGEVTLFSFLPAEKPAKDYEFAQILKRSICLEQNTQAWCENCEKYQPTVSLGGGDRHEGLRARGVRGAVSPLVTGEPPERMPEIRFLARLAALGYFLGSVNSSHRGKDSAGRKPHPGSCWSSVVLEVPPGEGKMSQIPLGASPGLPFPHPPLPAGADPEHPLPAGRAGH